VNAVDRAAVWSCQASALVERESDADQSRDPQWVIFLAGGRVEDTAERVTPATKGRASDPMKR
jgi:hypothetical protein